MFAVCFQMVSMATVVIFQTVRVFFHQKNSDYESGVVHDNLLSEPVYSVLPGRVVSNSSRIHNIHFLKMHKTGSTTLFGILNRVVLRYNLRTTTYSLRPFFSQRPEAIVKNLVPRFIVGKSKKFHIHAHHSRNDKEYLSKILLSPYSNITFVRNPVTLLRSWMYEVKLHSMLKLTGPDPFRTFVTDIKSHRKRFPREVGESRNTMADTFRIPRDLDPNTDTFRRYLEDIHKDFVVGITEYYVESLVLFRRRLGWTLRDIVYVPLRITKRAKPNSAENASLQDLVCAWSHLDCHLYNHFNKTFWKLVEKEEGFKQEVAHFRFMLNATFEYCAAVYKDLKGATNKIDQLNSSKSPLIFLKSEWNEKFSIGVMDCALMRVDEFPIENLFYYRQNPQHCVDVQKDRRTRCRVEGDFLGPHMCNSICKATNKDGMLLNFLKQPRAYLWH